MKKTFVLLSALLMLTCLDLYAEDYDELWKQADKAEKTDLPRTQIKLLEEIAGAAVADGKYGQLMKAENRIMSAWSLISYDSLVVHLTDMERKAEDLDAKDKAAAAVYYSVLGLAYGELYYKGTTYKDKSNGFFKKSTANPALLAEKKALDYEPFVVKGRDSYIFNDDLLSLLGYAAGDFKTMNDYYNGCGNRPAAMISALELIRSECPEKRGIICSEPQKSEYIMRLDSLINLYSDLKECGEVAIEKCEHLSRHRDIKPEILIANINKALANWGEWPHINVLRNMYKSLTDPQLIIDMPRNVLRPEAGGTLYISVRNTDKVTVTLSRLNAGGDTMLSPDNDNDYKALKKLAVKGGERVFTRSFAGNPDFLTVKDSIVTGALPVGVYLMETTTSNKGIATQKTLVYVSDLFAVHQELPGNMLRIAVLNATTGQPVPGAKVSVITGDSKKSTVTCDNKGETLFDIGKSRLEKLRAFTATDNALPLLGAWSNFGFYDNKQVVESVKLFTDRNIYRPGQTVHMAGVMMTRSGITTKAVSGRSMKIYLRDANYKMVAEADVVSDEYGAFSADFRLPSSGLTGVFTLRTERAFQGYASIRVEEYKRPSFNVEFPEVTRKYANGDTLVVTAHAKSYAGVPVRGAKVKYKITRSQSLWWRIGKYYPGNNGYGTDELFSGETVTDDDGTFKIEMPMLLPATATAATDNGGNGRYDIARFFTITAEADVTDTAGETRQGRLSLPLSDKPAAFGLELGEKIVRDSLKTIRFTLKNIAGKDIPGSVSYRIDNNKDVFTATANNSADIDRNFFNKLAAGRHTLTAVCGSDTLRHEFVLFGLDDTVPCIETPEWFYLSDSKFNNDGRPVCLQAGSSDTDVHILYTIISGNKIIESGTADLSNALLNRKITYKEEYGDGLLLNFIWVKNGKPHSFSATIDRPLPDKKLTLKWSSFRDRLTPGQHEEWTLDVTKADGTPADAHLTATLFDASLEQITPHTWSFAPDIFLCLPFTRWYDPNFSSVRYGDTAASKRFAGNEPSYNRMDTAPVYPAVIAGFGRTNRVPVNSKIQLSAKAETALDDGVKEKSVSDNLTGAVQEDGIIAADNVPLRENLNETALFNPVLHTDTAGRINIKFTLPESVTTWKFMALAHDRDINSGIITAEATAQKTVMIQPGMPRFIRKGDRATIAARIFNTSEHAVKGIAVMQLSDPETGKTLFTQKKSFYADADNTSNVAFDYSHKGGGSLLVCKIYASGNNFSDGEQHYLPVLSDEELVTNTVPFVQNEKGVKSIDIDRLFPSDGRNSRLTVEYTDNPAWLAIQSLPFIGTPQSDNSICLATAYYANSMAKYILKQSPRIKNVFELWRNENGNESLSSSLLRNNELKNIVVDETPWTVRADNETESRQRLAEYFNPSTLDNNLENTFQKLQKLQRPDGSWCWWNGGTTGSPQLTGYIAELAARLNHMTGRDHKLSEMLDKALDYLGKKVIDDVRQLKKDKDTDRNIILNSTDYLRYMYICALDGRKMNAGEREATAWLLSQLKKENTRLNIYDKALMSVILARKGETSLAKEYIRSLEEYSVSTKDNGRYYDSPRAAYSWFNYRIPVQVSVIEAMTLVGEREYAESINEMKLWLLQQKRVQDWETPVCSANAVYAFLNGRTYLLESNDNAVLAINGKQLDMPEAAAGTGYVKTVVNDCKKGVFTATKTSEGTSWGALYAQTVQKTKDISASADGFSITKELLSADGKPLATAAKGDRITVRITVTADKDYDFVQIKDKRAACMEPVSQLSGYRNGCYTAPADNATTYYFDRMNKGTHIIETTYHTDRSGIYETGTCSVQSAYAPEYSARTASTTIEVK